MGHGFTPITAADEIQVAILDQLVEQNELLRRLVKATEPKRPQRSEATAAPNTKGGDAVSDQDAGQDDTEQVMVDGSADPPPPPVKKTAAKKTAARKTAASRRKPVKD